MADEIHHEYDVNVGREVSPAPPVAVATEAPPELRAEEAARADDLRAERREARKEEQERRERINLVSHSPLFYWWPVWVVGYILAALTWMTGEPVRIGDLPEEYILRSNGPGLIYTLLVFFVILATSVTLRGLMSGLIVLGGMFIAVLFAWLGWWDEILQIIPHVNVHMNFGFYVLLSTLVFIMWVLTTFVFDRLSYWRVEAGQVTREHLVGGGEKSYDTHGLVLEERHDDLFRHWILGMGSGDLRLKVAGQTFDLPNVLLAGRKVSKIQKLIKRKPD